jgi:lysophospholipase L1-like esterase
MIRTTILTAIGLAAAGMVQAETAQEAWTGLVGKRMVSRPAFAFVEVKMELPNVLIYGDSISIGYTPEARKALAGKANVVRIHCNGGDSSSFIAKMDAMHAAMSDEKVAGRWDFEWDVIHFNVGLHDLKHMKDGKLDLKGEQVSTPAEYEANLRKIVAYLKKEHPKASLVWCNTTAVPEGSGGRVPGDAAKYNTVAMRVMKEHPEIVVNDLFTFSKPLMVRGNVHFKPEGCQAQGKEVAKVIGGVLKKRKK